MEAVSLWITFMATFLDPRAWERQFTTVLDVYENMSGMWLAGEYLPQETNRITLNHDMVDQFGLSVVEIHFDGHPNDIAIRNHSHKKGSDVYEVVGATRIMPIPPYSSKQNFAQTACRKIRAMGLSTGWADP